MLNRIATIITAPKTSLFFIGLMFFLPFCVGYHHLPIPAFYGEWLAALFGLFAMLTFLNSGFWQNIKMPQFSLVFLGLTALVAIQWMLGMLHSSQYALIVFSYLMWAFVIVLLGSYLRSLLGWEAVAKTLAWFIVCGAIFNVGFVVLQVLVNSGISVDWMPKLPRYGALAQPNNFADYIGLSIASVIYLYAKRLIKARWFWILLFL